MKKGKLVVIEGIYGTGKFSVRLVERLREVLPNQGREVYEIDSPDSGRAQLMGAEKLGSGWRYGLFKPDFFFEMASRARACATIRDELQAGKIVLCKNFTISSIAYAKIKGHDWFREDLNCLEARARGLNFGGEVTPNLTIFLDLSPESALDELGSRIEDYFSPDDLYTQQKCFKEELSRLPAGQVGIIDATKHEDQIVEEAVALIKKIL